jgi:hypothetical protein
MNATAYALTPDTKTIREKNRRDRKRQHAIDNVMERLDVFGVCLVSQGLLEIDIEDHGSRYSSIRKQQAAAIVDAVVALMKD